VKAEGEEGKMLRRNAIAIRPAVFGTAPSSATRQPFGQLRVGAAVFCCCLIVAACGAPQDRPLSPKDRPAAQAALATLSPPGTFHKDGTCGSDISACYTSRSPLQQSRERTVALLVSFGVRREPISVRCNFTTTKSSRGVLRTTICDGYVHIGRFGVTTTVSSLASPHGRTRGTRVTFDTVRIRD
jgi:hypothetical protein